MNTKTFKRFGKMVKPYIKTIIIVTFFSIIIDGVELIKPYIIQQVIDNYLNNQTFIYNNISLSFLTIVYIILLLSGNIIDYLNRCISFNLGEKVLYDLRLKLFDFIERANLTFHDKTKSGKLYVRITSDTDDIYELFTEVITTFPKDFIIIIGLIITMIYISAKLSIVNFVMVFILILTTTFITKELNKTFDKSKSARTKLNTFLAESIYGLKLIKIFNRQNLKQQECELRTDEYIEETKGLASLFGLLQGSIDLIENLAIAVIIVICINHFMGINLEIGIIYLFISYLKKLIDPINSIIEKTDIVTDAFSSIDKIYNILEQTEYLEDFDNGIKLKDVKGKIEFKNVWFAYEEENWILKDVSFCINPGESAALVGKTGSGKTTITALISRFYEIQKGEILLDGINIKDNVKLYSDVSDNEIENAIELSSANYFIETLPKGLNEVAKERGNSYSAGQKQLIAFSRIFAKNPPIFILDEATANIDTITEEFIQKSVDKLSSEKTSIFIAHRLSTIVNVDKIIVLDHGHIIEQGNHNELLRKEGYYAKLYNTYYESLG